MRTAIVILNWNTKEYLRKFLPGVLASANDAKVIVADNASSDGSIEMLTEEFPSVQQILLNKNYGFSEGYNKALEAIKKDNFEYYVLLNSDIEVSQYWLSPLVDWMDRNPDCGACSPKLHAYQTKNRFEYAGAAGGYIDAYGYPFCRGRVLNMVEEDQGQYDNGVKNVFWGTGACLLIRSSLFHNSGGLDKRFFAHMEEIDLCWRLQLLGFKISIIPYSVVWHLGGGTLPVTSPWKLKLNYRNNLLMLKNNLAKSYALDIYKKTKHIGKSARIGNFKARLIIFIRMMMDGASAVIYLVTGKLSYFKSVWEAHREYRKLQEKVTVKAIENYLSSYGNIATIRGWYPKWIVPEALLLKDRIWEKIHRL
ncbi:MAG: glycosyltransferase family 2 protein [Candidatus Cryptobacteroides sp.]